ncbi:hypothetical protein ELH94_14895 [Rhizobium leguminosarum]|uniref:DUF6634 family protein n=1 Tax=Rhizobium leguminosarum TaxID=384 RepID=UPI00103065EE|nr:DUF6634 family protein [Rhizobium leguminosarum]TAX97712.1 hypothetical protein ELH94_14895 [Rhizobium leguminosarum]
MRATQNGIYLGDDRHALLTRLQSLVADLSAPDFPQLSSIPVMIDSYKVSRREVPCLLGTAFGHPKILDGHASISSELFYFDPERGIARTMSRWYRLGTPANPQF